MCWCQHAGDERPAAAPAPVSCHHNPWWCCSAHPRIHALCAPAPMPRLMEPSSGLAQLPTCPALLPRPRLRRAWLCRLGAVAVPDRPPVGGMDARELSPSGRHFRVDGGRHRVRSTASLGCKPVACGPAELRRNRDGVCCLGQRRRGPVWSSWCMQCLSRSCPGSRSGRLARRGGSLQPPPTPSAAPPSSPCPHSLAGCPGRTAPQR